MCMVKSFVLKQVRHYWHVDQIKIKLESSKNQVLAIINYELKTNN